MSRTAALSLYALLVLIWSSHLGRDQDRPRGRARAARRRDPLRCRRRPPPRVRGGAETAAQDRQDARGDPRPAAVRVLLRARLLGRAVHPVRADRGAVRRDAALHRRPRCLPAAGRAAAAHGCWPGSRSRSAASRSRSWRASSWGARTVPLSARSRSCCRRSAPRSATSRSSGAATSLDAIVLNGWGMLVGGALLLTASAATEDWGDAVWSAKALGSILYLAVIGSAVAFVTLTILLRAMSAQASSFIALMIPFGALIFGAVLYSEPITGRAVAGAALVVAGLLAARGRPPAAVRRRAAARRKQREPPEQIAGVSALAASSSSTSRPPRRSTASGSAAAASSPAIPFTTKQELRESQQRNPPFGEHLCAPREELVRLHVTSGHDRRARGDRAHAEPTTRRTRTSAARRSGSPACAPPTPSRTASTTRSTPAASPTTWRSRRPGRRSCRSASASRGGCST